MMSYKKKRSALLLISIFIVSFFITFKSILPRLNNRISFSDNELTFSRESGFYDTPFELELTARSGTIYYTLDGTLPDKSAIKYEAPILITDASSNDNTYSMRTDVSNGFDIEAIEKVSSEFIPGYQAPNYKIDKATIVRAVVYDEIGHRSDVKTASYFVGFSQKNGYDGMSILSIVTEPSNLFDYETGIYVTGKAYDEYVKEYRGSGEYYWREEFWSLWYANYRKRGINWERKAICQFFDASKQPVLEQECGIRIHGGISRGYNPKSLNIYARKEYDGNKKFQNDLFGTGYYASAITLFQGGNDVRTKAKDYLISTAIKDLDISSMNYKPYILFLNGEYWGVYWLNEKYDARYLEYYYDVDKDNVIMMKGTELVEGEEDDYKYFSNMIEFCSQSDVTKEDNYEKVCELIDIESYIDYYSVMLYIGRCGDWPDSNYALWRVRKNEAGPFGDGKWRWMIYDLNSSGFYADTDSIQYVMDNDEMFKNLMTNDTFRAQLIRRIEELADTVFTSESMTEKLNEYQVFITEPMRENDRRFFGDDSLSDFNYEVEVLQNFFSERNAQLPSILNKYK